MPFLKVSHKTYNAYLQRQWWRQRWWLWLWRKGKIKKMEKSLSKQLNPTSCSIWPTPLIIVYAQQNKICQTFGRARYWMYREEMKNTPNQCKLPLFLLDNQTLQKNLHSPIVFTTYNCCIVGLLISYLDPVCTCAYVVYTLSCFRWPYVRVLWCFWCTVLYYIFTCLWGRYIQVIP